MEDFAATRSAFQASLRDEDIAALADSWANDMTLEELAQIAPPEPPPGPSNAVDRHDAASPSQSLPAVEDTQDKETEREMELELDLEEKGPQPVRADGEVNLLVNEDSELEKDNEASDARHNLAGNDKRSREGFPTDSVVAGAAAVPPNDSSGERASPPSSDQVVGGANDELLMETVLNHHGSTTATVRARTRFWDAIADAFVAVGGLSVVSRADVTKRVSVLTATLMDRPHLLTRYLRAMVLAFNERNCGAGFAAELGDPFLTTLRKHAAEGKASALLAAEESQPPERVVNDQHLLQLVLKHHVYDADTESETTAWRTVCDAYNAMPGDELLTPRMAQRRVRVATAAFLDCAHPDHALLSPALRTMLVELHILTIDGPAESVTDDQDEPLDRAVGYDTAVERHEEPMELDLVDDDRGLSAIHASNDELFMRTVLTHMPVEMTVHARTCGWDAIANAFVAAGGVNVTSRVDATQLLGVLSLRLLEAPHLLAPHLRDMIVDFNKRHFEAGFFAQRLGERIIATLRRHAIEGSIPSGRATASKHLDARKQHTMTGRAFEDERLMRLVMKHRPFEAGPEGKTAHWLRIVTEYNAMLDGGERTVRGRLGSAGAGQRRVGHATTALLDRTHSYHAFLTPHLRAMLVEFSMFNYETSNMRPSAVRPKPTSAEPVIHTPVPVVQATVRAPMHGSGIDQQYDELFMRLVLEKRPFDAKRGQQMGVWDRIADAFTAAGGEGAKNGHYAVKRIVSLRKTMFESPHVLTRMLCKMILEYYEHYSTSGPDRKFPTAMLDKLRRVVQAMGGGAMADPCEPRSGDSSSLPVVELHTSELTSPPSSAPTSKNKTRTALSTDELFMRIVLEQRPFDTKLGNKMSVWNRIADAFIAAGGDRVRNGDGATKRMVSLRKNMLKTPHLLTPKLRKMVFEYYEHYCESDGKGKIDRATLERLRKLASRPEENRNDEESEDDDEDEDAEENDKDEVMRVRAIEDERLVRLVLKLRPFNAHGDEQEMWLHEIVVTYNSSLETNSVTARGKLASNKAVSERLRSMTQALQDPKDPYHAFLSPALRLMLTELIARKKTNHREPSTSESTQDGPKLDPSAKSLDDVLLSEVLLIRFKAGQSKAAWDRVAKTVNTRVGTTVFTVGKSCKQRMQTLLGLYRDPVQAETLSASEREKLRQLQDMLERKQVERERGEDTATAERSKQPTRVEVRSRGEQDPTEAANEPLPSDESEAAESSSNGGYMTVLPSYDVCFLRLVLDTLPFAQPRGEKTAAWEKVAAAWRAMTSADTVVKLPTAKQAMRRVQSLVAVYHDRAHPEHAKLTKPLMVLLRKYMVAKTKYDTQQRSPQQQTNQEKNVPRATVQDRAPEPSSGAPPARALTIVELCHSDTVDRAVREDGERINAHCASASLRNTSPSASNEELPTAPHGSSSGGRRHYTIVLPSLDERLMRLVLNERPFGQPIGQRQAAWDKVAKTWRETATPEESLVHLSNGNALARVKVLGNAYRDRSYREHGSLTEPLKALVREYLAVKAKHDAQEALHQKQYRDTIRSGKQRRYEPEPEWETSLQPQSKKIKKVSPNAPTTLQPASSLVENDADAAVALSRSKRRSSPSAEENETAARRREKRKRVTREGSDESDDASIDAEETLVDEAAFRVALELQPFLVGYGLQFDAWDKVADQVNSRIGRRIFQTGAIVHTHIKRVLARLESDPESLALNVGELATQYRALLPTRTPARRSRQALAGESVPTAIPAVPVTPRSPPPEPRAEQPTNSQQPLSLPLVPETEVDRMRKSIVRLNEQVAMSTRDAAKTSGDPHPPDSISLATETATYGSELAASRAETKRLLERFELERREFRAQQITLVELLRTEREAQRRETHAMLNAMDRERKDRRDEFVAMTNLIARSVQPTDPKQLHDIDRDPSE